jgi:hypothetical protein
MQNSLFYYTVYYLFTAGGGKDRVELFIERAKKNVMASRNSLKTVIDILELDTSTK